MRYQNTQRDEAIMRRWFQTVNAAAAAFEARWTWAALKRADGLVARKLWEQRELFNTAMIAGEADEIELQGAAMCRGYVVATAALERVETPDDACMFGCDPLSGIAVAIGTHPPTSGVLPTKTMFLTPDEVAALVASSWEKAQFISTVKRLFPGATLDTSQAAMGSPPVSRKFEATLGAGDLENEQAGRVSPANPHSEA